MKKFDRPIWIGIMVYTEDWLRLEKTANGRFKVFGLE